MHTSDKISLLKWKVCGVMEFYKWIFLLLITFALEAKSDEAKAWEEFKTSQELEFEDIDEENQKRQQFIDDYTVLKKHERQNTKYKLAMNKFVSWSDDDMEMVKGYCPPEIMESRSLVDMSEPVQLASVDLRNHHCLPPVKDQGTCGCCYAFSSITTLSHTLCLYTGVKAELSMQDVIDCSVVSGNFGCMGGNMLNSFKYVANYGISHNSCYPYRMAAGTCKRKCYCALAEAGFTVQVVRIPRNNSAEIEKAIATNKTVCSAMDTRNETFKLYKSGTYENKVCNSECPDHAVVIVGFTSKYWIVQNSWGTSWGERGFIQVSRVYSCGLANFATYVNLVRKAT